MSHRSKQLARMRIKKDMEELSHSRLVASHASTYIIFPRESFIDDHNVHFNVSVTIDAQHSGPYANSISRFKVVIPSSYPFHAPNIIALTRMWHPNVQLSSGLVSFPLLNRDWRPVLTLNSVLLALQLVLLEPNTVNAINPIASQEWLTNASEFITTCQSILNGGFYYGETFENARPTTTVGSKRDRSDNSSNNVSIKRKC